jgi:PAS domain S-box-containing protein
MIEKNEIHVPLKVLSLEDSDLDFEIICEQLTSAGYDLNISRAETESEFSSRINNDSYDIILADYNLPQFDAFEALKLCSKTCPEIPFICVSGSIGEIMAIELLKMGAVDYVIKDRLERLPFAVKRALEDAREKKALKLAQEELKKKEENFRTLTENIPDIIARFDKDLRHIYVNPSIKKVTGISSDLYLGKTNEELGMPIEKVALWNKNMQYVFQTGKHVIFEFEFQSANATFYFSSMLVPEFDSDGNVCTILNITRDISENKKTEIALRKSEERLRDILFSSADWVWEVDESGKYTYGSQKANDFFELSQEEIIGKTPFDFMPEDEAKRVATIFYEIVAQKTPIKDLENWNIGKDGKRLCLLTNGVPIFDNLGQLKGYRGIDKDITERKLAEQELINAKEKAEESDRLKTAFLSNMSHEIRTPLNSIIGFSELLGDDCFDQEQKKEFVSNIIINGNNLLNILSDIMDISKIESGQITIRKSKVWINQFLDEVRRQHVMKAEEKGLTFKCVSQWNDSNHDAFILTDRERLQQIFNNLISNAMKFTSQGYIEIGYGLSGNEIEFHVKDTGIGISPEFHDKIFERFRQVEDSSTRKYGGNGLGLAITKKLIELMEGNIWVESEVGKGSLFYFTLPKITEDSFN